MLYLLIILIVLILIWLWLREHDFEPPVLSGKLPFIGNGLMFLGGDGTDMYNAVKKMSKEALDKDGVLRFYLGPLKFYIIVDPEDCLKIANESPQKPNIYNMGKPFLGNGLITADVPTWKRNRKLLNPAFNQHVLISYMDFLNRKAVKLVNDFADSLGKQCDQEKIIREINLETICSIATGVNVNDYGHLQKQYLSHFDTILEILNERIKKFWLHNNFIYKWTPLKKRQDEEIKHVSVFTDSLIIEPGYVTFEWLRYKEHSDLIGCKMIIQEKKSTRKPTLTDNSENFRPFMNLFLESAEVNLCNDEHIRDEINTFIAAGYDTISTALTIILTLLGSHLKVQDIAYDEIIHVFGNSERAVWQEDLSKLVYMEAILKETLRLYPAVPIIARQLEKDVKLKNYTLKANSVCFIGIYGADRHSIWGAEANEFKPERWLNKETLPDPKYFAAFSFGRRSCIGKAFAMMWMKVFLVHILRRYRISSDASKMVLEMNLVLKPSSGFHITLEHRKV